MLSFVMLGPFGVRDAAGRDRTPRPHKIRTALALLVLNAGQVVSTAQLTRELWPADAPRTAVTATHVYISRLRKHLQASLGTQDRTGYLRTVSPGYVFEAPGCRFDLSALRLLLRQAQQAEQSGDLELAADLLGRALDLWHGETLADVRTGARLRHVARQLDEAQLALCERRIRIDLLLERHQELIGELYGLAERYPHRENFHSHLMIALYRARRTTEALAVYTRLREWLVGQTGLEPGAEIQRLHQLVLSQDRGLDGDRPPEGVCARLLNPGQIPLPRIPDRL